MRSKKKMNVVKKLVLSGIFCGALLTCSGLSAQVNTEGENIREQQSTIPKRINFYRLFEENQITREEFELRKRQRMQELQERLMEPEAFEGAIDETAYIVGPGDIFYFTVWGAMEDRYPLTISPEGYLYVPSVGELDVSGSTLAATKKKIMKASEDAYEKSNVSLSLAALRFFRVSVVG